LEALPADRASKLLIIGCGNSSLGYDLFKEAGFTNIDNIDYSGVVIERMAAKYAELADPAQLRWTTMDMMDMTFPLAEGGEEGTFDVVIDKATMDVIMTDNKDPWNPSEEVKERGRKVMENVYRQLKPGGLFIQISFDQPHFRKKFILPEFIQWAHFSQKSIDKGLGFFMYIMRK
jgi:SAM-dependent methyltransferase